MEETIAAIATPSGEGAVALIRLSGATALSIADAIFQGAIPPSKMKERSVSYGKIIHEGAIIDEVLLTVFRAPRSYTGEDVVEISGHGGSLVAARVLGAALANGARLARSGEFTRRAYLNGKMDLTQAEAVMDLITAQTPLAQRAAAEQLAGRLGKEITLLRAELLEAVAHLEAFIDFPEEGINPESGAALRKRIEESRQHLCELLATSGEGRLLREGIRLAICGAPNAGKSSLLNRLLGIDRSIVHAAPGTTRDTIEEEACLGGFRFRLVDTAGLRDTDDPVESEGVRRAHHSGGVADIPLHVIDATEHLRLRERSGTPAVNSITPLFSNELLVFNKIDLVDDRARTTLTNGLHEKGQAVLISCQTGEGIDCLIAAMISRVTGNSHPRSLSENTPTPSAINARHEECLSRAQAALDRAIRLLDENQPPELLSMELREALDAVGDVVGASGTEEILGEIFGKFCIGK